MNNHTDNNLPEKKPKPSALQKTVGRGLRFKNYEQNFNFYLQQFKIQLGKGIAVGTDISGDILYNYPDHIFYVIPQKNEIRCFHASLRKNISLSYFAELLSACGYNLNDLETHVLYNIPTIFHDLLSNFIMINGIICFRTNIGTLPITCDNFDRVLLKNGYPSMSSKLKKKILYALKHTNVLYKYDDRNLPNTLFDPKGAHVLYSNNNLRVSSHIDNEA